MRTFFLILAALVIPGFAAKKDSAYLLLPIPQKVTYLNDTCLLSSVQIHTQLIKPENTPVGKEGYQLKIHNNSILITAQDQAGLFYAKQTLKQIMVQAQDGQIRNMEIEDWPDYANRGVMLDISRDKVPTMDTLFHLVDLFASMKINQLQLYTEHTFAYKNHQTVWKDASPMTPDQIRILDKYCRDHFIELVPNQNSFGHMGRWLMHEEYSHLAESTEPVDTPWGRMKAFSLCPIEPGSIKLLEELYDDLLPNFSSNMINVGCDETIELGMGRSKEICQEKGTGRVYLDFLKQIHALLQSRGKIMQFWGDIILNHPELIPELPKTNLIALIWGYEATHPYDQLCPKFKKAGIPFYVCPGTSSWNTLLGRTDNMKQNISNAAENGLKFNAAGLLNTNWGDNGHWQPLPSEYTGFAYGAAVSWAGKQNKNIDLPAVLSTFIFKDNANVMGQVIYDLGNTYQIPGALIANNSVLVRLLLLPTQDLSKEPYNQLSEESLSKTIRFIENNINQMSQARMDLPDAELIQTEIIQASNLLIHACKLGIERLKAKDQKLENISKSARQTLVNELKPLIAEHKRLWVIRNRPGGLKESALRLQQLLDQYTVE